VSGLPQRGIVTAFDESVGLGEVAAAGASYLFHCTQIADGSRTIEVGSDVAFEVVPGRHGRWEAATVRPQRS